MKRTVRFLDPSIKRKGRLLKGHLAQHKACSAPLFSLLEFNLTGLCTRKCVFCPRVDPAKFPNVDKHMPLELYEKVMDDIRKAGFDGTIIYSAFGEPLLYRHLDEAIRIANRYCPKARTEIVTNGDLLTASRMRRLFKAGLSSVSISMYDGPHQAEHFKSIQKEAGIKDDKVIFRVRWKSAEERFGITLSNRAGAVEIKEIGLGALKEPMKKACYYPFYQILIDHDGSALLCAHDWAKRLIAGNVRDESILDIWDNDILGKVRLSLAGEDRGFAPCDRCDAQGILIGRDHFEKWMEYYGK